jgi:predicted dehydrogenase
MSQRDIIRFSAIGLNHDHIHDQTELLLAAGAELVSFYAVEAELAAKYQTRFPQAERAATADAVLEDESIHLIISAAIPSERASIGIAAMRHGKDFMSDKPGFTTLDQLENARRAQAETGRIYSIAYSERFENRAVTKALELVRQGAIGQVIQTVGLGPHRARLHTRPEWFFQRAKYGGIIIDIGSHQFDQFLAFTGAAQVEIVAAQVANYQHSKYPEFEDFGDVLLRAEQCSGYLRVDWFTPQGLEVWGDTRLTVIGSDGYLEVRRVDIAGRPGSNHLFLVDQEQTQYIDCKNVELPYGRLLLEDIRNRTESAMSQEHCFYAAELALRAQAQAQRLGHLQQAN